jgi:hypothetical protein
VALFGAVRVARFVSARSFLQLPKDGDGAVCAHALFQLVQQRVKTQQNLCFVRYHDADGDDRIAEHELRSYLRELAPTLPGMQSARRWFLSSTHRTYAPLTVCVGVRRSDARELSADMDDGCGCPPVFLP